MPHQLLVKVRHLERAVVEVRLADVRRRPLQEHTVVVGELLPQIQMHEGQDVDMRKLREIENIRVHEVELRVVEVPLGVELATHVPVVAELVHTRGALAVPLELAEAFLLEGRVVRPLGLMRRGGGLVRWMQAPCSGSI